MALLLSLKCTSVQEFDRALADPSILDYITLSDDDFEARYATNAAEAGAELAHAWRAENDVGGNPTCLLDRIHCLLMHDLLDTGDAEFVTLSDNRSIIRLIGEPNKTFPSKEVKRHVEFFCDHVAKPGLLGFFRLLASSEKYQVYNRSPPLRKKRGGPNMRRPHRFAFNTRANRSPSIEMPLWAHQDMADWRNRRNMKAFTLHRRTFKSPLQA